MIGFVQRYLIAILATLLLISSLVAVVQTVRIGGFSIGPIKVQGLKSKADNAAAVVKAAGETVKASEGMRGQEQAQDKASFADEDQRCDARVATAHEAASIIKDITNDQSNAPAGTVRAIVPASELRRIIAQPATSAAPAVSAGGDGTATR